MDGTVVHLDVLALHHLVYLCSSPDDWSVTMSGEIVDRTVCVECRVKGKTCAYASALDLTCRVDVSIDVVPS